MLADALDLHLTIAYPYVITRGIDGRRTGEHAAITHTEARTMPRALHDITRERSLIQRATSMGACRGDGVELLALAQQDDCHARGRHTIERVLLDAVRRQHRFVVLTSSLPGSMVDASPFREDHLAAQIPGIEYTNQPHEAKNGSRDPITWTGQQPQEKGDQVEERRTRVE